MIARARGAHKFSRLAICLANDCTRPPSADDCFPPMQLSDPAPCSIPASFHSWKSAYLVRRCPVRVCVPKIAFRNSGDEGRRSLCPGLSAAAVTDFAIGNHRRCSGEIRVDHPFRQRGALDRREDPVHSTFFPIPVVAAARSSRAPIWTAA
jgi:hypothetical protein